MTLDNRSHFWIRYWVEPKQMLAQCLSGSCSLSPNELAHLKMKVDPKAFLIEWMTRFQRWPSNRGLEERLLTGWISRQGGKNKVYWLLDAQLRRAPNVLEEIKAQDKPSDDSKTITCEQALGEAA